MKKKWVIGCCVAGVLTAGLFAGSIALVVVGIFALTRPLVETSEQFLTLLGQGRAGEAYALTSDSFRAGGDQSSFTRAVDQLGLSKYASVSWHNRQMQNQSGLAEGTVVTKDGSSKPVSVELVREQDKWVIVGLQFGGRELTSIKSPPAPSDAELQRMVADALLEFNHAVQVKDFSSFYDKLSSAWKKETSPKRLAQDFNGFIENQIDIGPIKDLKPQIAPTTINSQSGMLVVTGHYATQPSQVRFELEYAREGNSWRLSGISVNVGKAAATD